MDPTQPLGILAAALAFVLPGAVLVRRDEWPRDDLDRDPGYVKIHSSGEACVDRAVEPR